MQPVTTRVHEHLWSLPPPPQTGYSPANERPPTGPNVDAGSTDQLFSATLDYNHRVATALGYQPSPLKCDLRGATPYAIAPTVKSPLYDYGAK